MRSSFSGMGKSPEGLAQPHITTPARAQTKESQMARQTKLSDAQIASLNLMDEEAQLLNGMAPTPTADHSLAIARIKRINAELARYENPDAWVESLAPSTIHKPITKW